MIFDGAKRTPQSALGGRPFSRDGAPAPMKSATQITEGGPLIGNIQSARCGAVTRLVSRIKMFWLAVFIFAISASVLSVAQPSGTAPVFNVMDYGARNDGSAMATEAFRAAIAAAQKAGGGTVYVPAGNYVSGPIEMVSNLTLYVAAGATIKFPAMKLPFTPGRQQGIETLTPVPLIGGHDLQNVAVEGRGVLTSSNADWMKLHPRIMPTATNPGSANGPNWEHLLKALSAHQPVSQAEYRAAAAELRPSFIRFMNCKNVLVEGLRILGSPMWTVHLLYTENAEVENMVIETYPGVHTDGIVVDSSRFIRLSNDYIDTGDDGIVIKSGKDADGLRVNRPSEDIAITNCTVHHAHGAVTIGSETSGSVRNLVASNITAVGTVNGIRIKSARGRGGVVEDVRFDNWTMRNVGTAIVVTNYYLMEGETRTGPQPVSEKTPRFRNIGISNITVDGAKRLIDIDGLPEMPIEGLHIEDIMGSGTTGLTANYTDDLELHNIQLDPTTGPSFTIQHAANLQLDNAGRRHPLAESPVIRLESSPSAIIRNCEAFPGTGVFLSMSSDQARTLHLSGNFLGDAKRAEEVTPAAK
jgi:polygalacturonase